MKKLINPNQAELDFEKHYGAEIQDALDYLIGAGGYVKAERLAHEIGVSGRMLRRIIIELRRRGHPVMSAKRGYCYARTAAERDRHERLFERRAVTAIRNLALARGKRPDAVAAELAGVV